MTSELLSQSLSARRGKCHIQNSGGNKSNRLEIFFKMPDFHRIAEFKNHCSNRTAGAKQRQQFAAPPVKIGFQLFKQPVTIFSGIEHGKAVCYLLWYYRRFSRRL